MNPWGPGKQRKLLSAKVSRTIRRNPLRVFAVMSLDTESPPEAFADSYAIEEGVSCETCHGAGSDFSKVEIMKNTARAMSLGLIIDRTGEQCLQCHNPSSPTWREDRFTTKEGKKAGFDYKSALELNKHPLKD